jgi:hypothetical protein
MDTDQTKRLAEVLETTTDYLFGLSDDEVPPDVCPEWTPSLTTLTPIPTTAL